MLFIAALSVFVLRVAQLHLGVRSTASPFDTFKQKLFSFSTVQTLGWYTFSAWWFSEVYIWSAPEKANLGWIAAGKYGLDFIEGYGADGFSDHGNAGGSTRGPYT